MDQTLSYGDSLLIGHVSTYPNPNFPFQYKILADFPSVFRSIWEFSVLFFFLQITMNCRCRDENVVYTPVVYITYQSDMCIMNIQ